MVKKTKPKKTIKKLTPIMDKTGDARRKFTHLNDGWKLYFLRDPDVLCKQLTDTILIDDPKQSILCEKGNWLICFGKEIYKCDNNTFNDKFINNHAPKHIKYEVAKNNFQKIFPHTHSEKHIKQVKFLERLKILFTGKVEIILNNVISGRKNQFEVNKLLK